MKPASLAPDTPLKGGNFVILSQIGQGGFGAVYRARQARLEREVAIKVLHTSLAGQTDMVERFRREALAAASLAHPHVLPVYDFDFDEELGLWFLAMRYVEGARSLDQLQAPLNLGLAVGIVADVAGALDAAHARAIVHRDVKPPNVLMDGTWPLLSDFGIAHLENVNTITGTGMAIGTPTYMSPEQALGRDVGPASDQYSLAVMAYQLLTGKTPFRGDPASLLYQHVHEPPPPPDTLNAGLNPDTSDAVLRAMSKDPADRFPSCTDFAASLAAATGGVALAYGHTITEPRAPATATVSLSSPAAPQTTMAEPASVAVTAQARSPSTILHSVAAHPVRTAVGAFIAVAVVTAIALTLARILPRSVSSPPSASGHIAQDSVPDASGVLLRDSFDDPSLGVLPSVSPAPSSFQAGYVDGEYQIAGHAGYAYVDRVFGNASISIDVRLVGDTTDRYINVGCHASSTGWYIVTMRPDSHALDLDKVFSSGEHKSLIDNRVTQAILGGNTPNHVELGCVGDTIDVTINGTQIASVKDPDSPFTEGWFTVQGGAVQDADQIDLRLDNLIVRQR